MKMKELFDRGEFAVSAEHPQAASITTAHSAYINLFFICLPPELVYPYIYYSWLTQDYSITLTNNCQQQFSRILCIKAHRQTIFHSIYTFQND